MQEIIQTTRWPTMFALHQVLGTGWGPEQEPDAGITGVLLLHELNLQLLKPSEFASSSKAVPGI